MAEIVLDGVSKQFPDGFKAVIWMRPRPSVPSGNERIAASLGPAVIEILLVLLHALDQLGQVFQRGFTLFPREERPPGDEHCDL